MKVSEESVSILKKALREEAMPLLSDEELEMLLVRSDSIDEAIYKGAIMKSEDTSLQISGMTVADTSKYFLRIAALHRPNNTGVLRDE